MRLASLYWPIRALPWGRGVATRLAATRQAAADAGGRARVAASAASADRDVWSAAPRTRCFHRSLRGGAPFPLERGWQRRGRGLVIDARAEGHADHEGRPTAEPST